VGSHCRSDQLDHPNRPNAPTKLDHHCLVGLVGLRDLFPTKSAVVWSNSDRVVVELIGYWWVQKCYPDHTRSLHDHFPINSTSTRPIPDHFSIASRAHGYPIATRLFDSQKYSCRKPDRCRPPRPLARPVPDRLMGLDRVDLIGSGNPHFAECWNQNDVIVRDVTTPVIW